MLAFMVSLSAGVLIGDAVLHLLPRAFGMEGTASSNSTTMDHKVEDSPEDKSFNVGLTVCFGMYLLFFVEKNLLQIFRRYGYGHSHGHGREYNLATQDDDDNIPYPQPKSPLPTGKSVGWAVLAGDSLHNIVDGLAIGASFASNNGLGWTTTVVILFHEIPHEAGDFAVLINSGFTSWMAIMCTGVSQLTAFIGLGVGLALGIHPGAEELLLAFTAGMFLYIGLVDLVAEMNLDDNDSSSIVMIRNIGLLAGVGAMAAVAKLEEALKT